MKNFIIITLSMNITLNLVTFIRDLDMSSISAVLGWTFALLYFLAYTENKD